MDVGGTCLTILLCIQSDTYVVLNIHWSIVVIRIQLTRDVVKFRQADTCIEQKATRDVALLKKIHRVHQTSELLMVQ